MISNPKSLNRIRSLWKAQDDLRNRVQRALLGAFSLGGSSAIFAADAAHNLPFVHACSVLNEVLIQLAKEGHYNCKSRFLGKLLRASEKHLPWTDFATIEEAVDRRNKLAHHGAVLPRADCWKYTDAIKHELVTWKII